MDWSTYFPAFVAKQQSAKEDTDTTAAPEGTTSSTPKLVKDVEIADIGCGFGGLLVALAPKLPDKLLLGELGYKPDFQTLSDTYKAWRFGYRLRNMFKSVLGL